MFSQLASYWSQTMVCSAEVYLLHVQICVFMCTATLDCCCSQCVKCMTASRIDSIMYAIASYACVCLHGKQAQYTSSYAFMCCTQLATSYAALNWLLATVAYTAVH